ncbi:MAG TPA: response regulator [Candidatus Acidoferrales bacterium]|nr:response regulator [Candidatus Acidoferrales bacterium]
MSDTQTLTAARIPTVYFIDDSATMREVIKIAFRKENIHVVTCPDAASALAQFGEEAPDAVITDVIMPDKDGYEVCQFIKEHEQFGRTPVILMSGVVNRAVAEKAMAVKADELIRKPFQPQDLISRVKNLLNPQRGSAVSDDAAGTDSGDAPRASSQALTSLFSTGPASAVPTNPGAPHGSSAPVAVAPPPAHAPAPAARAPSPAVATGPASADAQRLRNEVRRLEFLVKKLQAELEAQRQYCASLEAHLNTLQETE